MTAAIGLFLRLELPDPWTPSPRSIPLIIYGGSTAVGSYAIKLAVRANIHPLIVVAGGGAHYVEKLIDRTKGDTIIDYRPGPDAVVEGIQNALRSTGHKQVEYAFDAVSAHGSTQNILRVLDPHGTITFVLPYQELAKTFPPTLHHSLTLVGCVHGTMGGTDHDKDFGYVYFRYFARGLAEGWFTGHPYEVRQNGLEGVDQALKDLKAGKASAVKYVFRIGETPSLKK